MKRKALLVLSVLMFGVQAASASTFPADAEASYDLPAIQTYAERHAGNGDSSAAWGVKGIRSYQKNYSKLSELTRFAKGGSR